jgi:transposase
LGLFGVSTNPSRPKSAAKSTKKPAEAVVKDIRRATRRHFSAEDKIRIVLEGFRSEASSLATIPRMVGATTHEVSSR